MKGIMLIIAVALLIAACTPQAMEEKTATMEKPADAMMEEKDSMMKEQDSVMQEQVMTESFMSTGNVLAGTVSPYIEFNTADYNKAVAENKVIVLYFYADWCPLCTAEQPEAHAAFEELNNPDVVGFRVNYKDGNTDSAEEALAREHGITYRHTKVIVKNGERVLKALDSWDKERYLSEIEAVA